MDFGSGAKVAVALSGGVDSAAAAALLKARGYEVVGVTALIPLAGGGLATSLSEAASVARALGIPHEIVDLRSEFDRLVIEPFLEAYAAGVTPNPCVRCNRFIKFGLLLEESLRMGCEAFATGHYARVETGGGEPRLLKAGDPRKDQAYVLWRLSRPTLSRLMFPLGTMTREAAMEVAREAGVWRTAPESQDVCFLADRDLAGLLEGNPSARPGPIVDTEGRMVGRHRGIAFYTVGQRRGLGLGGDQARYVLEIRPAENVLVVGERQELPVREFSLEQVAFIGDRPAGEIACQVRTRYRGEALPCLLEPSADGTAMVRYPEPGPEAVPGQSAVLYDGEVVLGGGIITR